MKHKFIKLSNTIIHHFQITTLSFFQSRKFSSNQSNNLSHNKTPIPIITKAKIVLISKHSLNKVAQLPTHFSVSEIGQNLYRSKR